ncbi:MAG: InlB B-repeat-containing protein, partial [Clostridiales bacterium]|nr:InlB B-repeat-containing protein [Clostridiales bacterium]
TMDALTCGHGIEYTAPECEFEADGYRFCGWSTMPDGEVEYREGDTFTVERSTTMYAQWVKGMTELAGRSADRVYLINKKVNGTERVIPYLERTGLDDIAGDYDLTTHLFTFKNEDATDPDEVLLRGIADSAHNTFTYLNTANTTVYKLQKIDGSEDASVTLKLNDNGTAVYNNGTDAVSGNYIAGNEGSMRFTVGGETKFEFRLVHSSESFVNFMIRGEEYGTWNNITQAGNVDLKYTLSLDGYGYATMYVSGLNSSLSGRVTTPFNGRYVYTTGASAYTGDDGIEVMVRLYNSSLQVRQFACLLMEGSYSTISTDDTTVYTNVYLQRFETTLYGKPATDAQLDTATADKIELAGYSVVADSATYTYTNGDGETVTVKGKYSYDSTAGTLRIKPTNGGADLLFEVSMHGEGENRVPVFEPVAELFGRYMVRGLDQVFGPSLIYTMSIYNNNRAVFSFLMPVYDDTFYGNIIEDYTPVVFGEYIVAEEGKSETGGADPRANVYEFSAEISPQMAAYLYNMYYSRYGYPLNLNSFGSFRFQFVYS